MEKEGYSIHTGGFHFSDYNGRVSFDHQISNDSPEFEKAYSYLFHTPAAQICSEFLRIAEQNYSSLGLLRLSAVCQCRINEDGIKRFEFTV